MRQRSVSALARFFHRFGVVGGSDLVKQKEQLGPETLKVLLQMHVGQMVCLTAGFELNMHEIS